MTLQEQFKANCEREFALTDAIRATETLIVKARGLRNPDRAGLRKELTRLHNELRPLQATNDALQASL